MDSKALLEPTKSVKRRVMVEELVTLAAFVRHDLNIDRGAILLPRRVGP